MNNFIKNKLIFNSKRFPDKIAIRHICADSVVEISYFQILDGIKKYEKLLSKYSGKLIVAFLSTNIESYIFVYSCFYYNVIPLIQTYNFIENSLESLNDKFNKICEYYSDIVVGFVLGEAKIFNFPNRNYKKRNNLDNVAFIQLSSGTTDFPKAIKSSFGALENNVIKCVQSWKLNRNSIMLSWLPMSHSFGFLTSILLPLYSSSEINIISPKMFYNHPDLWAKLISQFHVSHAFLPNFALEHIIKSDIVTKKERLLDFSSLEVLGVGGEFVSQNAINNFYEVFKKCGIRYKVFTSVYGMSENNGIIATTSFEHSIEFFQLSSENCIFSSKYSLLRGVANITNVGSIFNDDSVMIDFDDILTKKELYIGEIVISTTSLADGYLEDCFNRKNNYGFFKYNNRIYFKTGDLGFILKKHLYIIGRNKDIIVIRGKNFPSNVVENILLNNLQIFDAEIVVTSINNDDDLYVFIETSDFNIKTIKKKIIKIMMDNFKFKIKEKNIFIGSNIIPRTGVGKINRLECKNIAISKVCVFNEEN